MQIKNPSPIGGGFFCHYSKKFLKNIVVKKIFLIFAKKLEMTIVDNIASANAKLLNQIKLKMEPTKKKRLYEPPTMQVIELKQQPQLLQASLLQYEPIPW